MKRLLLEQMEANRYINESWIRILKSLPMEQLDKPQGAFFDSIFGTFNHILLGDRIWLSRIGLEPFKFDTLRDRLCSTMEDFSRERAHTDDVLIALVAQEHDFLKAIVYRNLAGTEFRQPLYRILQHLHDHQCHHRGHISQMCHEQKIEIPDGGLLEYYRETDL